jgi:sugar/nucleoside kinase (ribokinase family)
VTPTSEPTAAVELVTIGHAIVDVLGTCDDSFLDHHSLDKGIMELVDATRAVPLYDDMVIHAAARQDELLQMSGGSAANTAVVAAVLGARAGFLGKVRNDELGVVFSDDIRNVGVHFDVAFAPDESDPTGRCLINVTPDAERTMCTYLGAARGLRVPDMQAADAVLRSARVTYLEGYLWDEMQARAALEHAISVVHDAGNWFSLTLSDPFCVDRFRAEWLELIENSVDVLFGNDLELCSLFETTDLQVALHRLQPMVSVAAITQGAKGCWVVADGQITEVPAFPVPHVVDTTGAGDAFAGGFLYGLVRDLDLVRCAELGALAAAEVISHLGARPTPKLRELAHTN